FDMTLADLLQCLRTRSGQIDQMRRNLVAFELEELDPWRHQNGASPLDLDVNVAPAYRQRGGYLGRGDAQLVARLERKGFEVGRFNLPPLIAVHYRDPRLGSHPIERRAIALQAEMRTADRCCCRCRSRSMRRHDLSGRWCTDRVNLLEQFSGDRADRDLLLLDERHPRQRESVERTTGAALGQTDIELECVAFGKERLAQSQVTALIQIVEDQPETRRGEPPRVSVDIGAG